MRISLGKRPKNMSRNLTSKRALVYRSRCTVSSSTDSQRGQTNSHWRTLTTVFPIDCTTLMCSSTLLTTLRVSMERYLTSLLIAIHTMLQLYGWTQQKPTLTFSSLKIPLSMTKRQSLILSRLTGKSFKSGTQCGWANQEPWNFSSSVRPTRTQTHLDHKLRSWHTLPAAFLCLLTSHLASIIRSGRRSLHSLW